MNFFQANIYKLRTYTIYMVKNSMISANINGTVYYKFLTLMVRIICHIVAKRSHHFSLCELLLNLHLCPKL